MHRDGSYTLQVLTGPGAAFVQQPNRHGMMTMRYSATQKIEILAGSWRKRMDSGVRSVPLYLSVPFILTTTVTPPLLNLFQLCDTHLRNKPTCGLHVLFF
jgi:hypothetical protein